MTRFDDQQYFNTTFRNPTEFYKATENKSGGTMFERDIGNDVVEEMFLYEFKQQYMGKDALEMRSFILAHTTCTITSIKASFVHSVTKAR